MKLISDKKDFLFLGLVAAIFTGEWFLKRYIEKNKRDDQEEEALHGAVLVTKYHNKGAFLNAGEKKSKLVAAISLMITVAASIVFVVTLGQKGNGLLKTGLALLLGGAFSNTYDRLKQGYVVDYFRINVKWKPLRNVIFNISDFCIMIGALLMAISD